MLQPRQPDQSTSGHCVLQSKLSSFPQNEGTILVRVSRFQLLSIAALNNRCTHLIMIAQARHQEAGDLAATPHRQGRSLYSALLASACEADIIALVLNADAPWSPFPPGFTSSINHPVTGVVTKADLASMEQISLVKCWLREAGAHNVLVTSAVNNNGVVELFALLYTEDVCR